MHLGCVKVSQIMHTWHCLPPEHLNHDGLLKTEYPSIGIHTVCYVTDTEVSGLADHSLHALILLYKNYLHCMEHFGLLK